MPYRTTSLSSALYHTSGAEHKDVLAREYCVKDTEWVVYTKVIYSEPRESGHISEYIVENTFTYEELVKNNYVLVRQNMEHETQNRPLSHPVSL